MRKILFLLFAFCGLVSYAQDQLITEDGDVLTVWDVEIASTKIFYKLSQNDEDSKSIAKSKILM